MTSRKAIFIDRDGTLIAEKNYLHKPEEVEFFPGVIQALSRAAEAGFVLVMVTNQSGVGRGYFGMCKRCTSISAMRWARAMYRS